MRGFYALDPLGGLGKYSGGVSLGSRGVRVWRV